MTLANVQHSLSFYLSFVLHRLLEDTPDALCPVHATRFLSPIFPLTDTFLELADKSPSESGFVFFIVD